MLSQRFHSPETSLPVSNRDHQIHDIHSFISRYKHLVMQRMDPAYRVFSQSSFRKPLSKYVPPHKWCQVRVASHFSGSLYRLDCACILCGEEQVPEPFRCIRTDPGTV